jgi:DNA-binding transcriptional LysR family regulator
LLTRQFVVDNPDAAIRIEAMSSREIARRLADLEIDAGLTYLDDETPPGSRRIELYRERYVLLAPSTHSLMSQDHVRWVQVAELPLCALTPAMRNRRIIDAHIAAEGARLYPVVEADTVGALYAHLTNSDLATVASHAWLHGFGVPPGLAIRHMVQHDLGPAVGLIVLDREPSSIVANALVAAGAHADFSGTLQSALDAWLIRRNQSPTHQPH